MTEGCGPDHFDLAHLQISWTGANRTSFRPFGPSAASSRSRVWPSHSCRGVEGTSPLKGRQLASALRLTCSVMGLTVTLTGEAPFDAEYNTLRVGTFSVTIHEMTDSTHHTTDSATV